MRAVVVGAFVNNDVQESFPAEQGMLTVRAEVFGFMRSLRTVIGLKERRTNFTAQLGPFFSVVVIQVLMRRVAKRALFSLGDGFPVAYLDGFERTIVFNLVGSEQRPVI